MKILLFLFILSFNLSIFSSSLDLSCKGIAEVNSSVSGFGNGGSVVLNQRQKIKTNLLIFFKEDFKKGSIQLPSEMRPPIGGHRKDEFELNKIEVNDTEIKANFRINALNKPRIIISRITGKIEYFAKVWPWSFVGNCSIYDVSKKKF
tara:strand:- start:134 stop:577 length:444 start_codon:yes stop_codon:yes gene_type:complete